MNSLIKFIPKSSLVLFLSFFLWNCQSKLYDEKVNDLVREANNLLKQGESINTEWKTEFVHTFTPENRAKFPSNREVLRPHAENQIKLLEQKQVLSNSAAEKFEQASQISKNEKEKRVTSQFAASFKMDVEIDELFKEQMKLVLDNSINDLTTFDRKFKDLTKSIELKMKERDELQSEGKSVLDR